MAVLSNQILSNSIRPVFNESFGPFLSLGNGRYVFDTQFRDNPIWLGHMPSALCGILQLEACWNGEVDDEFQRLQTAHQRLIQHSRRRLPANLALLKNRSGNTHPLKQVAYEYVALSILDQYASTYQKIGESIAENVFDSIAKHAIVSDVFVDTDNFRFGIRFDNSETSHKFARSLNRAGILSPVASHDDRLVQFVLNMAFRNDWLRLFWERLNLALNLANARQHDVEEIPLTDPPHSQSLLNFHRAMIFAKVNGHSPANYDPLNQLKQELQQSFGAISVQQVTKTNYTIFRDQILEMQSLVYEPTRQTSADEFDMLFRSDNPLAIVASHDRQIAAMVFAGQLGWFRKHGGVDSDPYENDPSVYYSMDLTVAPEFRGGTGRLMKQALSLLAINHGVTAIHGRNRDRLAAGMWAVNLSLGSYELQRLQNDYQDNEEYRDCIYYRSPLTWQKSGWTNEEIAQLSFEQALKFACNAGN